MQRRDRRTGRLDCPNKALQLMPDEVIEYETALILASAARRRRTDQRTPMAMQPRPALGGRLGNHQSVLDPAGSDCSRRQL
jgi:hypothetical protein